MSVIELKYLTTSGCLSSVFSRALLYAYANAKLVKHVLSASSTANIIMNILDDTRHKEKEKVYYGWNRMLIFF
jgi:hypothetical protein